MSNDIKFVNSCLVSLNKSVHRSTNKKTFHLKLQRIFSPLVFKVVTKDPDSLYTFVLGGEFRNQTITVHISPEVLDYLKTLSIHDFYDIKKNLFLCELLLVLVHERRHEHQYNQLNEKIDYFKNFSGDYLEIPDEIDAYAYSAAFGACYLDDYRYIAIYIKYVKSGSPQLKRFFKKVWVFSSKFFGS